MKQKRFKPFNSESFEFLNSGKLEFPVCFHGTPRKVVLENGEKMENERNQKSIRQEKGF